MRKGKWKALRFNVYYFCVLFYFSFSLKYLNELVIFKTIFCPLFFFVRVDHKKYVKDFYGNLVNTEIKSKRVHWRITSENKSEKFFIVIFNFSQSLNHKTTEKKPTIEIFCLYLFLLKLSGMGIEPGPYFNFKPTHNLQDYRD